MKRIGFILVFVLFATPTAASTLVWTIENAMFGENSPVTGSFTYNSDTQVISNLLIQTVPSGMLGATYTTEDVEVFFEESRLSLGIDDDVNLPFGMRLVFLFDSSLPAEGGVVEFGAVESRFLKFPFRITAPGAYIESSPVPIPGALVLMLSALGVMTRLKGSNRIN